MAGAISNQTTNLSNLSVDGTFSAGTVRAGASVLSSTLSVAGAATFDSTVRAVGAVTAASTASIGGAVTLDSTLTVAGATTLTTSVAVGGGVAITRASVGTIAVAAIVAPNATSTTTTATISGLSTVDLIMVGPTSSGMSAGLSLTAFPNAANTVTLIFNNGSASTVTQAAGTYRFAYFRANG